MEIDEPADQEPEIETPTENDEPEEPGIEISVSVEEVEEPEVSFLFDKNKEAEDIEAPIPPIDDEEPAEPTIEMPADAEEIEEPAVEIPVDGEDDIAAPAADDAEASQETEKPAEPAKEKGGFFSRWF